MRQQIVDEIIELFKDNVDDTNLDINLKTEISDLALDSFSFIRLIVMLEDIYHIEFNIEDMRTERFRYIYNIVDRVNELCIMKN